MQYSPHHFLLIDFHCSSGGRIMSLRYSYTCPTLVNRYIVALLLVTNNFIKRGMKICRQNNLSYFSRYVVRTLDLHISYQSVFTVLVSLHTSSSCRDLPHSRFAYHWCVLVHRHGSWIKFFLFVLFIMELLWLRHQNVCPRPHLGLFQGLFRNTIVMSHHCGEEILRSSPLLHLLVISCIHVDR